jgi:pyruvate-formate lyase-activating enzyme
LEIFPFHHYGASKYIKLQKGYKMEALPPCTPEFLKKCVEMAEDKGFEVTLGD